MMDSRTDNRFDEFIKNYDCTEFDILPKFIKRRVDALKKIQLEHVQLQHQYHKELQELEMKYEKLYKPLYEKRRQIVAGDFDPCDEDCQLPANIVGNNFTGDQENSSPRKAKLLIPEEHESAVKMDVPGIPGFWLGCLLSTYNFSDSIEKHDRPVLRYLNDISLTYEKTADFLIYKLDFHFANNPFFTNKVLTKSYYLKLTPDERDPFSYEGFEVIKSMGCEIDWNLGKDVTTHTVTVKQRNKNSGHTRQKKKDVERDSFFYFFKPPTPPDSTEDINEELHAVMAVDFELGEIIRQSLIPKAVLYYIGLMVDDDDDEDDDEDSEDDDDDDEDTFENDSNDHDDSLNELNDSDDHEDSSDG